MTRDSKAATGAHRSPTDPPRPHPPPRYAWGLRALYRSLSDHRELVVRLVRRDVAGRYKGSAGGIGWAVFTPIVMLAVYLFVFGIVFNPRRGGTAESLTDFGLSLFCGVIVFGMFAECLSRAHTAVVSQPNFVKKVVFPIEVLPLVTVGTALFHLAIGLGLVLLALPVFRSVPPTALLLPLILLPLVALCMGAAWLVAALAVYLRDVGHVIGLLISVLMFLSPVFYPISAVPEWIRPVLLWNPLTLPIEMTRGALLAGVHPPWTPWAVHAAACLAITWLGFAFFQKTRKGFADVL